MKNTEKKENMVRAVTGYNPNEHLEHGDAIDENGNPILGQKVFYLPAAQRLYWYNLYREKNKKVMSLVSDIQKCSDGLLIIKATLSEKVKVGETEQVMITATGLASTAIGPNDPNALERCETCAKARCLGAAGFTASSEKSVFDEGETPVDGSLMQRPGSTKTFDSEKQDETKSSQNETEKAPDNKDDLKITQENDFFDIPSIKPLPELSPQNTNDDKMEESELNKCLLSFFPFGSFKGNQVIDLIANPRFIEFLKKMQKTNYKDKIIDDGLTVNRFVSVLSEYLIDPSKEDRKELLDTVKKIREDE